MDLRQLAIDLAKESAAILRDHHGRADLVITTKSTGTDMVSAADLASETYIRRQLELLRPGDAILAEEDGGAIDPARLTWVVDPLDGTTNYLYDQAAWAVSVACVDDAGPLVGVVVDPVRGEVFAAQRGRGAERDGRPIRVSEVTTLDVALVGTGFSYRADERISQAAELVGVIGAVRDIRRSGAAAVDLCSVACGRLDVFYEAGLAPWDWSAGSLIVTEAGGVVRQGPSRHGPAQLIAGPAVLVSAITSLVAPSADGGVVR